jgi:hypothetical protein
LKPGWLPQLSSGGAGSGAALGTLNEAGFVAAGFPAGLPKSICFSPRHFARGRGGGEAGGSGL